MPPIRGRAVPPQAAAQKPVEQKSEKKPPQATPLSESKRDQHAIWEDGEAVLVGPQLPDHTNAIFVPAHAFGGAKEGYVFKKGDKGLGYYLDTRKPSTVAEGVGGKGSHRKHAYEYFSEWDRFDVEGELRKLDAEQPEAGGNPAGASCDDGLPSGLTPEMLRDMPKVEVERRALNEKEKGNEYYKVGEYHKAIVCYAHSLRLDPNNAAVYANRAMCNLKLRRYKLAISDSDAAIQLDDG